jgi:hypothetical protein
MKTTHTTISSYNAARKGEANKVCDILRREVDRALPDAESTIWHGSPVWFLDGNPIQWDYKNIVKRKGVLARLK